MPQLDQVTFLSQYFWLLLFFLAFYLIMSNQFIPKIGRILLYRKRKTVGRQDNLSSNKDEEEEKKVRGGYETLLSQAFKTSREEFQKRGDQLVSWLESVLKGANKKDYLSTNKRYLTLLADKEISQEVALETSSRGVPDSLTPVFLFRLFKTPSLLQGSKGNREGISRGNGGSEISKGSIHKVDIKNKGIKKEAAPSPLSSAKEEKVRESSNEQGKTGGGKKGKKK